MTQISVHLKIPRDLADEFRRRAAENSRSKTGEVIHCMRLAYGMPANPAQVRDSFVLVYEPAAIDAAEAKP